jgi:hypothetical protein
MDESAVGASVGGSAVSVGGAVSVDSGGSLAKLCASTAAPAKTARTIYGIDFFIASILSQL